MNAFIGRILEIPGRYAITSYRLSTQGRHYWIEVDQFGDVFQLNPKGERDGMLRPYYWVGDELVIDPRSLHIEDRLDGQIS